jgi:hypothetical protein
MSTAEKCLNNINEIKYRLRKNDVKDRTLYNAYNQCVERPMPDLKTEQWLKTRNEIRIKKLSKLRSRQIEDALQQLENLAGPRQRSNAEFSKLLNQTYIETVLTLLDDPTLNPVVCENLETFIEKFSIIAADNYAPTPQANSPKWTILHKLYKDQKCKETKAIKDFIAKFMVQHKKHQKK